MSAATPENKPVLAACLTPPAVGGVAVVQVVGQAAPAIVAPFLRSRRGLDLQHLDRSELRLCRIVDGSETIDDALVSVWHDPGGGESADNMPGPGLAGGGEYVVDLSLHGGPRVVQRVLLLLKRAGARIVEPSELRSAGWPTAHAVEGDVLAALPRAPTRAVGIWLARMIDLLPTTVERIISDITAGSIEAARSALADLVQRGDQSRYLLDGVRVVLTGGPNTGKSTLANALAERERSIVSDTPGTTRDWVEHPAAVAGVPFTFVDTAGLRETDDPVEREAVRRARDQTASADVILQVMDASAPPTAADQQAVAEYLAAASAPPSTQERKAMHTGASPVARSTPPGRALSHFSPLTSHLGCGRRPRRVFILNKSDRPLNARQASILRQVGPAGLLVSARTGAGLEGLRRRLVQGLDWFGHLEALPAPFTPRQIEACRDALSAVEPPRPDGIRAIRTLRILTRNPLLTEDRPPSGYNQT